MRTERGAAAETARGRSRLDLKVYGMRDAASAQGVRDALTRIEGVEEVRIDVPTRRVTVWHAGPEDVPQTVYGTLRNIGLHAVQKA